jgi:8-oxo-dGTP pyrophosphatase MutT (NUDIX family)
MSHDLFEVSIKGLVFNSEGKLLLLKDDKGVWDLLGGHMEYGETFAEALSRECQEEVGVGCKILNKAPDYVWPGLQDGRWRVNICFKVELDSEKFVTNDESVEWGYFNAEEARKLNLSEHLDNLKAIYD